MGNQYAKGMQVAPNKTISDIPVIIQIKLQRKTQNLQNEREKNTKIQELRERPVVLS